MHHLISGMNFLFHSVILVLINLLHSQLISHVLVHLLHHHHSHQPLFTLPLHMENSSFPQIFPTMHCSYPISQTDFTDSVTGFRISHDWQFLISPLNNFSVSNAHRKTYAIAIIILTICLSGRQSVCLSHG